MLCCVVLCCAVLCGAVRCGVVLCLYFVTLLIVAVSSYVKSHKIHKDDAERVVEDYERLLRQ